MRTAFDRNDASANVRTINQAAMKKYLAEAPWGIGMAVGYKNIPANNKYTFMATVPPDSEYVFIWIHTGIIGITIFLICTAIMIFAACWQFPNCLVFYGGLTIVYVLPFIENEWIEYENKQLAIQEEKKRLKLEKKRASRVKL